jgi:TrmH family RNA methyltransferase
LHHTCSESTNPQALERRFYNESLLSNGQHDQFEVVLVSPRNPLNIGAAARAMANFGFSRLAVVAPYEAHWREAQSAVGAEDLLQHASVATTLAEALAESTLAIGTGTLTHRKAEQRVIPLPELAPLVGDELARGGRLALVFGPEKHGLTREDLAHCHLLVEIPTDAQQPSMNLGQAVAVCLYELVRSWDGAIEPNTAPTPLGSTPNAPAATLDRLADLVEQSMQAAGYSPRTMQAANRHDLRLLMRRLHLNSADTRRALGIFRRILWRLQHPRTASTPQ